MGFLNFFKKNEEADRAVISIVAATQVEAILRSIGPYSVRKILTAVDEGKIDGRYYGDEPEDIKELNGAPFVGCLLGWAGFLENLPHEIIRGRAFRPKLAPTWLSRDYSDITEEAETFVAFITEGDLPSTNPYLAILRQIVVDELNRIKLSSDKILIELPAPVKIVEIPELVTAY